MFCRNVAMHLSSGCKLFSVKYQNNVLTFNITNYKKRPMLEKALLFTWYIILMIYQRDKSSSWSYRNDRGICHKHYCSIRCKARESFLLLMNIKGILNPLVYKVCLCFVHTEWWHIEKCLFSTLLKSIFLSTWVYRHPTSESVHQVLSDTLN